MYLVDFIKRLFRKANIGIVIYLVLNILLYVALFDGFTYPAQAALALVLYLVSLIIALSPIGEWILRRQSGCKIISGEEAERLKPLFNEVYEKARALDPSISDSVKLYISDDPDPNAFATGRKTICVTSGLLIFNDEQIKGTLAHEFGHIAHKDTDLLLLICVGNLLMSIIFFMVRLITNFVAFIVAIAVDDIAISISRFLLDVVLAFFIWAWTKLGTLLVLHSGRENEFEADKFAYDLGYGEDLEFVLDCLGDGGSGRSLWANLQSTHPENRIRIERLQQLSQEFAAL